MPRLRVLLVADTHLGFDLPYRPRVERRRRGPDFVANFERALEPARRGEVDLVVHGGDLLFRSRVRRELVYRAFEPLIAVANGGVPVVVVPGNHERSAIPYPLLAAHGRIHILDRPRTVQLEAGGCHVAVAGFPFQRENVEAEFPRLVGETGCLDTQASIRLLCLHQTIEGARVGPSGYTFRRGADVIRGRDIPPGLAAVLAGHIHRHQVLTADLAARPLAAPVLYPGSIERTSAAERNEPKGYMTLDVGADDHGGCLEDWSFNELPSRPMIDLEIQVGGLSAQRLRNRLERLLAPVDPDAVVRLNVLGRPDPRAADLLRAESLRSFAPATMTLTLRGFTKASRAVPGPRTPR
ncbi:MAG: metallophosphoesterase [bacterium]|nr:metallophosphoesterase [bacterium]